MGKRSKSAVGSIILAIALFILSFTVAGGFMRLIKGGEENAVFALTYQDKIVRNGDSLGVVKRGADFFIAGSGDYTIRISAKGESDFRFYVGEEPYQWADVQGIDFTNGFKITTYKKGAMQGFLLDYDTVEGVLSTVFGMDCSIPFENTTNEIDFTMTVKGTNGVTFSFDIEIISVVLDQDYFIF